MIMLYDVPYLQGGYGGYGGYARRIWRKLRSGGSGPGCSRDSPGGNKAAPAPIPRWYSGFPVSLGDFPVFRFP